jgi:hypothetical protein
VGPPYNIWDWSEVIHSRRCIGMYLRAFDLNRILWTSMAAVHHVVQTITNWQSAVKRLFPSQYTLINDREYTHTGQTSFKTPISKENMMYLPYISLCWLDEMMTDSKMPPILLSSRTTHAHRKSGRFCYVFCLFRVFFFSIWIIDTQSTFKTHLKIILTINLY